jgi:hypothetical protein
MVLGTLKGVAHIRYLVTVALILFASACDAPPKGEPVAPPSSARIERSAEPHLPSPPPKQLIPTQNGVCRFEERDPAERPRSLTQTNYKSNMIFWADKRSGLWDHSNGFIDEGMILPAKRIVAVREGMKDLWISPNRDGPIYLYSGPEIFECRQHSKR